MKVAMIGEEEARRLIGRARNGHRSAFDRLFSSVQDRLRSVIQSRMGTRLRQRVDPDDVLQELERMSQQWQ